VRPRVSFVLPCYNYARYLSDCLKSIFGQEGERDFEVIAVDDGSSDDTQEVLKRFADPRLKVLVHSVNQGHVATINEGLAAARGEFIARIDPDDRYRPYFLAVTLDKFRSFPDVGLVYGDAAVIDESGVERARRSDRIHGGRDFRGNEFLSLLEENFICSPTAIARREAWLKALPVPEGLAFHDWYFTLLMAREHDFYYVNHVLADYRVHALNHHGRIVSDKSEESSIFRLLDQIFAEKEKNQELEAAKGNLKPRIYGAHHLTLATKYFGLGMYRDSRRCYLRSIRLRPSYLFEPALLRRLAATYMGRRGYAQAKELLKPVLGTGAAHDSAAGDP